ncbi:hypothetical protein J6590_028815, partial [Homalodisca vitripennis]
LRQALEKSPQKIPAKLAGLSMKSLVLRRFRVLTSPGDSADFCNPGISREHWPTGITDAVTA